jgi:hypothetical protein
MANFVYNAFSGESSSSQWSKYLQERQYYSDVSSAIKSQTKSYQAEIQNASATLSASINDAAALQATAGANAAAAVVSSLDQGFAEIAGGLDQLNSMLDWRLSITIDQQRISNLLLENVALLLRIPDVQKERQYYIEQGFKHYKNAAIDDDLFEDALENLVKAEKLEKADYVVLHRIGIIYLYSPKMLDLSQAEAYFRKAAKYAVVESDPAGQRAFNILTGQANSSLAGQSVTPDAIKRIAGDSYFQAGIACYAQGQFADALELSSKAYRLLPSMLEAGFLKAKALAATGSEVEAAQTVQGVIEAERFYAVKTLADGDLAPKSIVQRMLLQLRDGAVALASQRVGQCRTSMIEQSEADLILRGLDALIKRNTYLDALAALDGLTAKRSWKASLLWDGAKPQDFSIEEFIPRERTETHRLQEESSRRREEETLRKRQEQVQGLMFQAWAEEGRQNSKWFGKDFQNAIVLYEKAAALGSEDARIAIKRINGHKNHEW